jgi:hypothetical protein
MNLFPRGEVASLCYEIGGLNGSNMEIKHVHDFLYNQQVVFMDYIIETKHIIQGTKEFTNTLTTHSNDTSPLDLSTNKLICLKEEVAPHGVIDNKSIDLQDNYLQCLSSQDHPISQECLPKKLATQIED